MVRMPVFVARTTPSRRPPRAWPSSLSLEPRPYISAVSSRVVPRSIARAMACRDESVSGRP